MTISFMSGEDRGKLAGEESGNRGLARLSDPNIMRKLPLLAALCALICSCQTLKFYQQAVTGQVEIFQKSRRISSVVADPNTPAKLRQQLGTVLSLRQFASEYLSLPGDSSYGTYADLGRPHVVWVLYAAPEFSLKAKTWHYPAIGEMDYRGYFHEPETRAFAADLKSRGYDVFIGGVDAYSTLGWFHDPILNTFVDYPDVDLAETLFHELTHRKVFRRDDTVFNESLATTVAEEGVRRWLRHQGRAVDLKKYEQRLIRRREFYREIDRTRVALERLYASATTDAFKRSEKIRLLALLRDDFRELRRRWGGRGLEGWLHEDLNNGHLVSLKLYAEKMPVFQKLLADSGGDLDRFFHEVTRLK
jgi:predicted aminopeptidase